MHFKLKMASLKALQKRDVTAPFHVSFYRTRKECLILHNCIRGKIVNSNYMHVENHHDWYLHVWIVMFREYFYFCEHCIVSHMTLLFQNWTKNQNF